MKLSQDDKDLLALLAFRGEATIGDLARELRRREHTVRYNLKKLLDNELCFFYAYINPHSLGYVQYELFISIKSGGELGRKALMKALADNHRVTYVGTLAGEYQVDAIFHSQSLGDFRETIDSSSVSECRLRS